MKARWEKLSGAAGVLSPLLAARRDLDRHAIGWDDLLNVVPIPEGGFTRLPGTRLAVEVPHNGPARFIPFDKDVGDTYMLLLNRESGGDGWLYLLTDGALVVDGGGAAIRVALPADVRDSIATLKWTQVNDVIFLATGKRPYRLSRTAPTTWVFAEHIPFAGPVRTQNLDRNVGLTVSQVSGTVTVNATQALFVPEHVGSVWRIDDKDLGTYATWAANETVAAGSYRRWKGKVYVSLDAGDSNAGSNPPESVDSGAFISGAGKTTWGHVSDAVGYFRITAYVGPTQVMGTVQKALPISATVSPSWRWSEGAWSDVRGWPTGVALMDNSLVWSRGNELWVSRANDLADHDNSTPDEPDAALAIAINAPDGRTVKIEWMLAAGVLIAGARGGEWTIRAADSFARPTATNVRAIPQGDRGTAAALPVFVSGGAVYLGRTGRKLHFAQFDSIGDRIQFTDLTAFARHMLRDPGVELAHLRDPFPVLFIRTAAGRLVSLTFDPEQRQIAPARHDVGGVVERIAAVQRTDDSRTELHLIVRRTIGGTERRFVETMQPFFEAADPEAPAASAAWFLTCGLSRDGSPVTSVSGLGHLEGRTVDLFGDGQDLGSATVASGSVTLPAAASAVTVGLPMTWRARTLPVEMDLPRGTTAGGNKRVGRVSIDLYESLGGRIGAEGGEPREIFWTGTDLTGGPQALRSGVQDVRIEKESRPQVRLVLSGDRPLPFTLLALSADVEPEDR